MADISFLLMKAGLVVERRHSAGMIEVQCALPGSRHVHRSEGVLGNGTTDHVTVVVATDLRGALAKSTPGDLKMTLRFSCQPVGLRLLALPCRLSAGLSCLDVAIEACEHLPALVRYSKELVTDE